MKKTFKGLVGDLGEKAVRAIVTEHNGGVQEALGRRAARRELGSERPERRRC